MKIMACLAAAHNFLLSEAQAHVIFERLIATIREHWGEVCEEAELGQVDRKLFWGRQFLNPFSTAMS